MVAINVDFVVYSNVDLIIVDLIVYHFQSYTVMLT